MRTVFVPRSIAGEEPAHLGRAEARPRSVATVARSVSRPTGFSTTASMPWACEGLRVHPPGPAGDQDHGGAGPRSLRRPGHLETGAARQHEVRHHEIDRLAAQQRDRLAHVARGSHE